MNRMTMKGKEEVSHMTKERNKTTGDDKCGERRKRERIENCGESEDQRERRAVTKILGYDLSTPHFSSANLQRKLPFMFVPPTSHLIIRLTY